MEVCLDIYFQTKAFFLSKLCLAHSHGCIQQFITSTEIDR